MTRAVDVVEEMRVSEMIEFSGACKRYFPRPVLVVAVGTAGEVIGKYGATAWLLFPAKDASMMDPCQKIFRADETIRLMRITWWRVDFDDVRPQFQQ